MANFDFDDDLSLSGAIEATEHLTLRELGSHVHVGPLPPGSMTPLMLPLKESLAEIYLYFLSLLYHLCSF